MDRRLEMKIPDTDTDRTIPVRRREVMKVAGATAVGSVAFAGSASAHWADCVFFCGCGRMVAYGNLPPEDDQIVVAKEGGGSGRPKLSDHKGVEHEDPQGLEFTQKGRGKILALVLWDEDELLYNPNQCAQNVFDEYEDEDSGFDKEIDTMIANWDEGWANWGDFETIPGEKGHCHPPREHKHDHC